ncbi:hypothetical protein D3C87_1964700 [compost metagenome]
MHPDTGIEIGNNAAQISTAEIGFRTIDRVHRHKQFLLVFPDQVAFKIMGNFKDKIGVIRFYQAKCFFKRLIIPS